MIGVVNNRYTFQLLSETQRVGMDQTDNQEKTEPKTVKCDTFECSADVLSLHDMQEGTDATLSVSEEEADLSHALTEEEPVQESAEGEEGSTSCGGSVSINAAKLARKLAAAKTEAQIRAVLAEIRQDIKKCESGEAQGMEVDEASIQAAQNLLNEAQRRMGSADDRESTPEEKMAFSLAGLL